MPSTAFNPGSAAVVTGASAQIVAARTGRRQLFLTNSHATQGIFVSLGTTAAPAALNAGIYLAPAGGACVIAPDANNDVYDGPVQAIATGAGTTLCITEI